MSTAAIRMPAGLGKGGNGQGREYKGEKMGQEMDGLGPGEDRIGSDSICYILTPFPGLISLHGYTVLGLVPAIELADQ